MKRVFLSLLILLSSSVAGWAGCHIEELTMPCTLLEGETQRAFSICLPDGYAADASRSYPVLYLLHGGGCSHTEWEQYGRLPQQVDSLVALGLMEPMIIVCAEANEGGRMIWFNEPEWRYEDYFFQELLPYVESHYRVSQQRGHRSIAGFSMGGGGAVGYGLRHPELFSVVYAMSAYLRRQPLSFLKNDPRGEWRQQNVERHNPIRLLSNASVDDVERWKQVKWFIDCGDHDFTLDGNMDFVEAMRRQNLPYQLRVRSGRHNWDYWRPALTEALQYVTHVLRHENHYNPLMWADTPDPDVIRVGNTFYLVTTTMHLMPGAPVMKSADLVNWQHASYLFDRLTDSPKYDLQGSTVYGRGQWATSLKHHDGRFWALFSANEPGAVGDTYLYTALKAEGPWQLHARLPHFHDASLFFDDDGRVYVFHGTGQVTELNATLTGVKEGGVQLQLPVRDAEETNLLEGSRVVKHRDRYYLLMISWPAGKPRRQLCYRADRIEGPYEKRVILEDSFDGFPYVGQGTIVDDEEGNWYGVIFQDRGAVGRVLTLEPCQWENGWPMLGDEHGRVPGRIDDSWLATLRRTPAVPAAPTALVESDDFSTTQLKPCWQWNHNPVNSAWSLSERTGWLRLKTSRTVDNLYAAPNTLSQRTEGPACSASVCIDVSHLTDGDQAGFAAFNGHSGVLCISQEHGRKYLSMQQQVVNLTNDDKTIRSVDVNRQARIRLHQDKLWLRIDADFRLGRDIATFHYSLDGQQWHQLGPDYQMRYDWQRVFMGTRLALFCYATRQLGGHADFTDFRYTHE